MNPAAVLEQLVEVLTEQVLQRVAERIGGGTPRASLQVSETARETPRGLPPTKRRERSPTPKALPPKRRQRRASTPSSSLEAQVQIIQTTLQAHGSAGVRAGVMRSALGGAKPAALKRARELGILISTGSGKATMYFPAKPSRPTSPASSD